MPRYTGPLKAAVLDWAGTVIDFGCQAPSAAFIEAFAQSGITVSIAEARAPMGMSKRDHIVKILSDPSVASAWRERHGREFTEDDVDSIYRAFVPLQIKSVALHAKMIPGAVAAIEAMRRRGLKIGTTTGYPRAVIDVVARAAAEQGYTPDIIIAAEDTIHGRPSPFPAFAALHAMGVYPVEAVVKIGDTVVDIGEGLNGGMWTVGLTVTGNEVGLTEAEWNALSDSERSNLRDTAAAKMKAAGAHYVIDSIELIQGVLDAIEARLALGEKP